MNEQRGVGTVITNLVILAAAVVFASVIFFWALSSTGQMRAGLGSAIHQSNVQISEQFQIEEILFNKTVQRSLTVYVRNFGDSPITIVNSFIDAQQQTISQTVIAARGIKPIKVNFVWTDGTTYKIRVNSLAGNYYEAYYRPL